MLSWSYFSSSESEQANYKGKKKKKGQYYLHNKICNIYDVTYMEMFGDQYHQITIFLN